MSADCPMRFGFSVRIEGSLVISQSLDESSFGKIVFGRGFEYDQLLA